MTTLKEVDKSSRSIHSYLKDDDKCFFFEEYTSHAGYAYSKFNQLISNFKKEIVKKDSSEWAYKLGAIETIATWLASTLSKVTRIKEITIVPIPSSKRKENPEYDDRLMQVLKKTEAKLGFNLDIRELVLAKKDRDPLHKASKRLSPDELKNEYLGFNESAFSPLPKEIILFDDILTNGTHFRAVKDMIREKIPEINVIGIFVGRRIFPL